MPLPYQPENNDIPVKTPPTGFGALRTLGVSGIYLDNFDPVTASWVDLTAGRCGHAGLSSAEPRFLLAR